MIRRANKSDLSRIAEILVFVKRMKYRSIFHNDAYSFGELQVIPVAEQYSNPEILENIWVYEEDEIVKGLIHIENNEVMELYERGIRTCLKEWMIFLLRVSMGMMST